MLSDAIDYADRSELGRLIDQALARGARLDLDLNRSAPSYDEHPLVCVVRANKPWAIPILMARGARVPVVPANGEDLVMEACLAGRAEMVSTLIEVARYDIAIPDNGQKTALHYAAFAGSADCVAVLLEHGADANVVTSAMDDADLDLAFGPGHELYGCDVTPLMIAAGRGDEAVVRQLLEAGAATDAGACAPLIIAARRDYPAILRLLFEQRDSLDGAQDQDGRRGLFALLHARASIDCLRIAVPHHDFSADSGGTYSPLGLAIEQRAPAVVALFLGCGATIEPQSTAHRTLWDRALLRERNGGMVLEMMAATSPCEEFDEAPDRFCELLGWIVDRCVDPPALASDGLFPSLLQPATQALQQLRRRMDSLSERQLALQAAFALLHHLRPLPARPPAPATPPECIDLVWVEHTETCRHKQQRFLLAQSQALVDECLFMLNRSMSAEFFIDCLNECPAQVPRADFIKARLANDMGLPEPVTVLLVAAWSEAADYVAYWSFAPNDADTTGRFGERYAHQRLRSTLDFESHDDPALAAFLTLMTQTLENAPAPLTAFCGDPVAWLRKFEGRNNLQLVIGPGIDRSLAIELGLPPSTCAGIASAWQEAIEAARESREWQASSELTSFLAQKMRDPIKQVMGHEDNNALLSPSDRQQLQKWGDAILTPSSTGTRKRPAGGNPDGEPPSKDARH